MSTINFQPLYLNKLNKKFLIKNIEVEDFFSSLQKYLLTTNDENASNEKVLKKKYIYLIDYIIENENTQNFILLIEWLFCQIIESLDNSKDSKKTTLIMNILENFMINFSNEEIIITTANNYINMGIIKNNSVNLYLSNIIKI